MDTFVDCIRQWAKQRKGTRYDTHFDDTTPNYIVVCKAHYIDCLIKALSVDNLLATQHIPYDTFQKRNP